MKQPKVAIVILNWNGKFFLERFLPSVYNSNYPNLEIIIGDNNSSDGSVAFVEDVYPNIRIIQNKSNLGYAGGYNAVLQHIEADYFALLNSDVEVSIDWIEALVEQMENNSNLAAVQPKIRAYHDRQLFEYAGAAGGFIDSYGYPFCRGRILHNLEKDESQYDDECEIFWASGAALFIRSSCWHQANGFDADFFAHMEEIDLCWRLKRMGYSIAYCPKSVIYHVGGGTLPASNPHKTYLNFRNSLYMLQKNLPFWKACWVIFIRLWLDLAAVFHFLIQRNKQDAWAVSRAHQTFFRQLFNTAKKRNKINHPFKVSGRYRGSIIWSFYISSIRKFSRLNSRKFS